MLQRGVATLNEQNGRLEITGVADFALAGYVTVTAHDLTESDISVDEDEGGIGTMILLISPQKTVNGLPWTLDSWYSVDKDKSRNILVVARKVLGGSLEEPFIKPLGPPSRIRIAISGGVIYFYEDETLLYSEPYSLPTYNCYIYVWGIGVWPYVGMGYYDNFTAKTSAIKHILSVSSTPPGIPFEIRRRVG